MSINTVVRGLESLIFIMLVVSKVFGKYIWKEVILR